MTTNEVTITRDACERALECCDRVLIESEVNRRNAEFIGSFTCLLDERITNFRTTITALRKALEDGESSDVPKCRNCSRNAREIGGYLHRVNELGIAGIWECRPNCSVKLDPDQKVLAAIEGTQ